MRIKKILKETKINDIMISVIWGLLGQLEPGFSKLLITKITILQKTPIFKVLDFYKKPLKFSTYKKQ